MAHPAQAAFCRELKERFPQYFRNVRVLEVGSRNINGTVRDLFEDCDYIGVDSQAGPGVDVVALGHEYAGDPESFDVVCAVETFEHDPHAPQTVAKMVGLLRPGGLFFMTCAGVGRTEHGTKRTGKIYGPDPSFYRNVSEADFESWLGEAGAQFSSRELRPNRRVCDLYCYAIKTRTEEAPQ